MLPHHYLHPARDGEHLVGVAEEAAAVAEQADVVGELLRICMLPQYCQNGVSRRSVAK